MTETSDAVDVADAEPFDAAASLTADTLQLIATAWTCAAIACTCRLWRHAIDSASAERWRTWLFARFPHTRIALRHFRKISGSITGDSSAASDYRQIFSTQLKASRPPSRMASVYGAEQYVVSAAIKKTDGTVLATATAAPLRSSTWDEPMDMGLIAELTRDWEERGDAHNYEDSKPPLPGGVVIDLAVTRQVDMDTLYLMRDVSGTFRNVDFTLFPVSELDPENLNALFVADTNTHPADEVVAIGFDCELPVFRNLVATQSILGYVLGDGGLRPPPLRMTAYAKQCPNKHVMLHYGAECNGDEMPLKYLLTYLAVEAPWPSRCTATGASSHTSTRAPADRLITASAPNARLILYS